LKLSNARAVRDTHSVADTHKTPRQAKRYRNAQSLSASTVEQFAARLMELNRRILTMYLIDQMSVPAIAACTSLTQGAVWMRLQRICAALREELRRRGLAVR
jgi:DNA-directed RNA polymerase specialized sigma24 family protein